MDGQSKDKNRYRIRRYNDIETYKNRIFAPYRKINDNG